MKKKGWWVIHHWNDKGEIDWRGISEAADWIGAELRKWGRMDVSDTKEKFGTVRVYCSFGWWSLHTLTHPGYAYIQYKSKLLRYLNYSRAVISIFRLLNWVVVPYHKWLYTRTYGRALEKWPLLRSEILQGADHSDLLRKYGIHSVRTGANSYEIRYDWHPDNYYVRFPRKETSDDSDE